MTTIYQGWTPAQEIDERLKVINELADASRGLVVMQQLIDRNMRNGFYMRHPHLIERDTAELRERVNRLEAAIEADAICNAHVSSVARPTAELEIASFSPEFHPDIPAMPDQDMEMEVEIGENLHPTPVAYEGQSRPGWSSGADSSRAHASAAVGRGGQGAG